MYGRRNADGRIGEFLADAPVGIEGKPLGFFGISFMEKENGVPWERDIYN